MLASRERVRGPQWSYSARMSPWHTPFRRAWAALLRGVVYKRTTPPPQPRETQLPRRGLIGQPRLERSFHGLVAPSLESDFARREPSVKINAWHLRMRSILTDFQSGRHLHSAIRHWTVGLLEFEISCDIHLSIVRLSPLRHELTEHQSVACRVITAGSRVEYAERPGKPHGGDDPIKDPPSEFLHAQSDIALWKPAGLWSLGK